MLVAAVALLRRFLGAAVDEHPGCLSAGFI